jgi:hypothetical protein
MMRKIPFGFVVFDFMRDIEVQKNMRFFVVELCTGAYGVG